MEIKIYTLPTCSFSDKAKLFLKKKKIKFEEISLFKNEEARLEMIDKSGQMATPVIDIDVEIVIGFDETELNEILKEKVPEKKKR